jgi:hypothetical protein
LQDKIPAGTTRINVASITMGANAVFSLGSAIRMQTPAVAVPAVAVPAVAVPAVAVPAVAVPAVAPVVWTDLHIANGDTSFGDNYFITTGSGMFAKTIPIRPGLFLVQRDDRKFWQPSGTHQWYQWKPVTKDYVPSAPTEQPRQATQGTIVMRGGVNLKGTLSTGNVIIYAK